MSVHLCRCRRLMCVGSLVILVSFFIGCGGGGSSTTIPTPVSLSFSSTPPTTANEGVAYSYLVQTNISAVLALASAPAGATLQNGVVSWTPTAAQARVQNQFSVSATSGSQVLTQNWSVTPNGTIRGTTRDRCVSDDGTLTSVASSYSSSVTLYYPKTGGGFNATTVNLASDGTFAIPNIGPGSFWLATNWNNSVWTASNNIDFGYSRWGWCENEATSASGTTMAGTISGMLPWTGGGEMYLLVPNEGFGAITLSTVGLTTATYSSNTPFLFDASKGDNVYAAQLVPSTSSGVQFSTLQRSTGPLPITIQNGVANTFDVALGTPAQMQTFRANIKGSAFAAQHAAMNPNGTSNGVDYDLRVTPDSTLPLFTPMSLLRGSNFLTDIDAGDVTYGNPFPATWTTYLNCVDEIGYQLSSSLRSSPLMVYLASVTVTTQFPSASNPLSPLVGPVGNAQLNGVSLFSNQTISSGGALNLSWQAPQTGTATAYRVALYQIQTGTAPPGALVAGTFHTTGTSMTLPPLNLVSGGQYYIVISSLNRQNDATTAPFRDTLPWGSTDVGSGLLTVQ